MKKQALIQSIIQWIVGLILLATSGLTGILDVSAQASDANWATPVNLSHSGAASNPLMVVSTDGQFHVIWSDKFAGTVYTVGDGAKWSQPAALRLPFLLYQPVLVADSANNIHAFWLDEKFGLYHSRVPAPSFATATSWSKADKLAENVYSLDATVDSTGHLHLIYLQALDSTTSPSGIYYYQMDPANKEAPKTAVLYQSPYFRSLKPENAHVKITVADQNIYAVWDNPGRERVFFSKSADDGANWSTPIEVDAPKEGTIASGPFNITASAQGNSVLLIWQTNRSGPNCDQYYQWSQDGGNNWQPRQRMLQELPGCSQSSQLLAGNDGLAFLLSTFQKQMYLLAWNGSRWSSVQPQAALAGFADPDTFKPVEFGCRQAILVKGTRLYVVGCDTGGGKDIWITSRALDNTSDWFSQTPAWKNLTIITTGPSKVLTPILVTDPSNHSHAFWSQANENSSSAVGTMIYYSQMDGTQWSTPVAILSSPSGKAEQPSATVDVQGHLFLVWSGGQSGEIYFSQVSAARAMVAPAWSEPKLLPGPIQAGSSPNIQVDPQGRIYVIYTIPLNEKRGVYITRSDDGGQNWSAPVMIFDAGGAGWAMVDHPYLSITGNGQLHAIWTRYSLPGGSGPLGLYYSRSQDGGQHWLQAETVTENPAVWSRIVSVGEQTVHRFWQEFANGSITLWHEQSLDGGVTWKRISPVSIFGLTVGDPSLSVDHAGHLQLLEIINRSTNSFVLQHWFYDGQNWQTDPTLDLSNSVTSGLGSLASVASLDGNLDVAFAGDAISQVNGQAQPALYFTSRQLEIPAGAATELPPQTPVPVNTSTPTPNPSPSPTPTSLAGAVSTDLGSGLNQKPSQPGNAWLGSIVGPGIAGLIILVVFVFSVRRINLGRR